MNGLSLCTGIGASAGKNQHAVESRNPCQSRAGTAGLRDSGFDVCQVSFGLRQLALRGLLLPLPEISAAGGPVQRTPAIKKAYKSRWGREVLRRDFSILNFVQSIGTCTSKTAFQARNFL